MGLGEEGRGPEEDGVVAEAEAAGRRSHIAVKLS